MKNSTPIFESNRQLYVLCVLCNIPTKTKQKQQPIHLISRLCFWIQSIIIDRICMEINGATVATVYPSASVKQCKTSQSIIVCMSETLCQKVNGNVKAFSKLATPMTPNTLLDQNKLLSSYLKIGSF